MAPWIDFQKIKREADFAKVLRHYGFEFPDGRNQLKLPCPFHEEGRSSLSVNLEGKVFHCFGCGAKGNLVEFLQRMEKRAGKPIGTRQAMLKLADICGIAEIETERSAKRARRPVEVGSGSETIKGPPAPLSPAPEAPTRPEEPR